MLADTCWNIWCMCSVYASTYMCMCAYMCVSQSDSLAKPNIHWIDWLASQLWRSVFSYPLSTGVADMRGHTWLLSVSVGILTWALMLQ